MLRFNKLAAIPVMGMMLLGSQAVLSQDRHDDKRDNSHFVRHDEWKKGYHMPQGDWGRGDRVTDYGHYHLQRPPRGYEWRRVDGNFVMAAVATGVIASVVAAAAAQ
jgi:Ni/Co efflux regulator RcnB